MNIREIIGMNPRYSEINREERNYAALFYHAIMFEKNASLFLKKCGENGQLGKDFGIYFEYSMLRDLWFKKGFDETKKKEVIRKKLNITGIDDIMKGKPSDINRYFGVMGKPSQGQVQYPGKWSISKYNKTILNNADFEKVCKFKWSFNIKPDIVIHLDKNRAICIEAKYESGEGHYPSQQKDNDIFNQRKLDKVGQLELQEYMMNELLGINTKFIFLVFKEPAMETPNVLTWSKAFEGMDLIGLPRFAEDMLKNVKAFN
jgi:hypothetical protein